MLARTLEQFTGYYVYSERRANCDTVDFEDLRPCTYQPETLFALECPGRR
jgi:hypothetical protein